MLFFDIGIGYVGHTGNCLSDSSAGESRPIIFCHCDID